MKTIHEYIILTSLLLKIGLCWLATQGTGLIFSVIPESMMLFIFMYFCKNKTIIAFFIFPLIIINSLQISSIYSTGEYIVPLVLLNIQYFRDIGNQIFILIFISIFYILLFVIDFIIFNKRFIYKKYQKISFIPLMAIYLFIEYSFINFPVHNFIDTTSKVIDICSYQHINKESIITNSKIANAHELFGINLDKNKKYNIIVLFIEGTSYQILRNDLTSNLCKIQNESINIINYYNHTLPTFRGIRGQLTSTYQLAVGADDKLPKANSLAYIMNTLGYNSVFVSPHAQQSKFNTWIKSIEFNKIYSLKKNKDLTDREMYSFLYEKIKEISKLGKPFFACAYFLGTHHGMDSSDKKYGDGQKTYLNKFYNHDFWFGDFFKEFSHSSLYENTILVITTDHASLPSPEMSKTFSFDNNYGVNTVPFIIHYKGVKNKIIDGQYRNSLSFAPTLLDMISVTNVNANFLGNSIFVKDNNSEFSHISNIDFNFYETSKNGVHPIAQDDPRYAAPIKFIMEHF
ncbi:sulfatase-like hydrolase/transferase [Desulfobulbus oralis]|uniref:Sulfatase N-terminal domain-containing protein n=1 Tax=Desulfobulbus oralis TaxID=1986146 RepID=A0A2L1GQV1_9BACT|nr:sulfatase-like hydrolase/transferase [Desulfobulbus oralis]AVD72004.1 hypothetical protein CAY53_11410 [Desulfobulbus oralis]